jgi:hypothetical protein
VYEDYMISNYILRICILWDTFCTHQNDQKLNVCKISLTIIFLNISQRVRTDMWIFFFKNSTLIYKLHRKGNKQKVTRENYLHYTYLSSKFTDGLILWQTFSISCTNQAYQLFPWNERNLHMFNLLKTKRNLLYIRHQSVPRCKHFPPWL